MEEQIKGVKRKAETESEDLMEEQYNEMLLDDYQPSQIELISSPTMQDVVNETEELMIKEIIGQEILPFGWRTALHKRINENQ